MHGFIFGFDCVYFESNIKFYISTTKSVFWNYISLFSCCFLFEIVLVIIKDRGVFLSQ